MYSIEVNNGNTLELTPGEGGVIVTSRTKAGTVERRDFFGDDIIVMTANLLRYMRDNDTPEIYLLSDEMKLYLQNLLRNGDIEEYRIFQ